MKWALAMLVACGSSNPAMPDAAPDAPSVSDISDPIPYVDPTIGTGGYAYAYGSCFVGAAAPHGMIKLGPDTSGVNGTINFLHYSGYWAGDTTIQGFSHLHLHGAGATDYGVLSMMPTLAFDPSKHSVVDYQDKFAKADEHAAAGLYTVTLASGVKVELTAAQRAAAHRYTFPSAGTIVVDLSKTLDGGGSIDDAAIALAGSELSGHLHHIGGMSGGFGGYTIYFAFTLPTGATATTWSNGAAISVPAGVSELRVSLSYTSVEEARMNHLPTDVDFDGIVKIVQQQWRDKLGRVAITATDADARVFYTSLYHAFLMPSVIDNDDGTYQLAGKAVTTASGYAQMSDMSLWDTYRTVAPLYSWLAPESARDQARSLVGFADGLGSFPRWPIAIGESGTMLGASAEIAVADAVVRGGVTDLGDGYAIMRAEAMDASNANRGERGDVTDYLTLGYVPRDKGIGRTASDTTEFSNDDFALAQLATANGDTATATALMTRRLGWRKLYDPSVGYVRGKNFDGTFPTGSFDPLAIADDYAEANAWQSLWMTGIHDADGMAAIFGSQQAAVDKLGDFFAKAKVDWDTSDESAANFPRPYYWHGNEPDLNAAALFAQLGHRDLAIQWTKWIEDSMYSDKPEGVAGNDDGGTLGAWYVLNALGLYPIAGSDRWVVLAPRFAKAVVTVGGHTLTIVRDGDGAADLDGAPVQSEVTQSQLSHATTLHFASGM